MHGRSIWTSNIDQALAVPTNLLLVFFIKTAASPKLPGQTVDSLDSTQLYFKMRHIVLMGADSLCNSILKAETVK